MKMTDESALAVLDALILLMHSGEIGVRGAQEAREYLAARLAADQQKGGGENPWQAAVDQGRVVAHLGIAADGVTREEAVRQLGELIDWHVAVALDPAVNGGFVLTAQQKGGGEVVAQLYVSETSVDLCPIAPGKRSDGEIRRRYGNGTHDLFVRTEPRIDDDDRLASMIEHGMSGVDWSPTPQPSIPALAQQPAVVGEGVDLQQFRQAVVHWYADADNANTNPEWTRGEAERLLAIIDAQAALTPAATPGASKESDHG